MTTTHTQTDELRTTSYNLRLMIAAEQFDTGSLTVAGETVVKLANELFAVRGDAFSLHLAADAYRMAALGKQSRVSPDHARSVTEAAANRIDRQLAFDQGDDL